MKEGGGAEGLWWWRLDGRGGSSEGFNKENKHNTATSILN